MLQERLFELHLAMTASAQQYTCPCLRMKITLPLQHFVAESKLEKSGSKVDRSPPLDLAWRKLRMQVAFPGRR